MCTMKELEEMKRQFKNIFGRLKPPRPFHGQIVALDDPLFKNITYIYFLLIIF